MLSVRIVTAFVLISLVLAALFLLTPKAWAVASAVVIAVASHEWATLVGFRRSSRLLFATGTLLLMLGLVLLPFFRFARGWPDAVPLAACFGATLFWLVIVPPWLHRGWRAPPNFGSAAIGWLILIGAWVALVQMQAQSPKRVLAAMAVVWIADSAAYFCGRRFGRHKLAPAISPGKSWEGVAGGLAAVAVYAVVLALAVPEIGRFDAHTGAQVWVWLCFALAVAALSVTGDLFESLLKRHAGVKDSGRILPGHGGVLDRIDALLAAMPPLALGALLLLR